MNDTFVGLIPGDTPQYDDKERFFMLFVLISLSIFAVVGNVVQFVAIYLEASLQTASNIFILSLGCSDIAVGMLTLPTVALTVYNRAWIFSGLVCRMTAFIDSVVITASMWTLGFTALDRYLLVQSPISHRSRMTKLKARKTVLLCWAIAAGCSVLPLIGWSEYSFSVHSMSCAMKTVKGFESFHKYYFLFYVLVSFPVPIGMIIACYILIFHFSVSRRAPNLKVSRGSVKAGSGGCRVAAISHIRTAKITLLLIVFVLACILPTFVIGMIFWFEYNMPFTHQMSKAVIWSLLGNSACNPILYGWFNKHFRSVYKHMILSVILREKYSTLRRSVLSMKSTQGTPKLSLNNPNPLPLDSDARDTLAHSFGHSLKLLKRYHTRLNRGARGSNATAIAMSICCASVSDVAPEFDHPRRHSIAGPGDLYLNVRNLRAPRSRLHFRSQPDIKTCEIYVVEGSVSVPRDDTQDSIAPYSTPGSIKRNSVASAEQHIQMCAISL